MKRGPAWLILAESRDRDRGEAGSGGAQRWRRIRNKNKKPRGVWEDLGMFRVPFKAGSRRRLINNYTS